MPVEIVEELRRTQENKQRFWRDVEKWKTLKDTIRHVGKARDREKTIGAAALLLAKEAE